MTFTVVIGVGLTDDVLGPEPQHAVGALHVGRAESDRLVGSGRDYGTGPLPTFLAQVGAARDRGSPIGLILVGDPVTLPREATSLGGPFQSLAAGAVCVPVAPTHIPWAPVLEAIRRVNGADPLSPETEPPRFLLVGCHTEQQILALALVLRSVLAGATVAVSPHLVGSAASEAHLAVLRHHLPRAGVEVILDLGAAAAFAGLDAAPFDALGCTACALEPDALRESLDPTSRRIIELLCAHWTRAHLKPLSGGFSGSLLLLASGWKGDARTEPMVIKVDRYPQMRRELEGYQLVKDLLGKHVPTFNHPVLDADHLGVGMDLAAMEGAPVSLQDSFEAAISDGEMERFLRRLDKSLVLLATRLYRNTSRTDWVSPYRAFHLHTDMQLQWLAENVAAIATYWSSDVGTPLPADADLLAALLRQVAHNEDGVESEVCLAHGDLNYKNIISDDGDNVWFIDWTHCARLPIELDFAKLENDAKFVMSKECDLDDLPRLRRLEDYLLSQPVPATPEQLPESLRFVRWDLRYRKILETVRRIRQACFALKRTESWLVYRAALLKYALHSLSFDKRRGRGECELPQLMHALHSLDSLLNDLVVDEFQLKIRGERPPSYPPRQRVSIDFAPWSVECPEYQPPCHVEPDVLAHDRTRVAGGWADPEDVRRAGLDRCDGFAIDAAGRPLHPFGRTGIAGRGALGRWGPNPSVLLVVTRDRADGNGIDILLGAGDEDRVLLPPQGFVRPDEDREQCVVRVLETETGWRPDAPSLRVSEGYGYDARRTDHAWVVVDARLIHLAHGAGPAVLRPGGHFESVAWYPLDAATINRIPAEATRRVRDAIRALEASGSMSNDTAASLLAATGRSFS